MKWVVRLLVTLGIALWISRLPVAAAELRAGVAVEDITPPRGYPMAGCFAERFNTGTHDPLHAKAVVFQEGEQRAALVFCDLIGIPLAISRPARELAATETGIPVSNIAIAATHSHTGPKYSYVMRNHAHERIGAKQDRDPHQAIDYPAFLIRKIVTALAHAQRAAVPVRIAAGVARENRLSFNRRFHMKDGTVQFNPGPRNPNIVRPAGPIDPEVGIVGLRTVRDDRPLAALVVFALHLDTVGGTAYSADYPYQLETELRKSFGPDWVCLFGAGTCGDINHINVASSQQLTTHEIGMRLAQDVREGMPKLKPLAAPSLAVRSATIEVPAQQPSAAEIAHARAEIERIPAARMPFLQRVRDYALLDLQSRYPRPTMPLEVQAFRLGPELALVTLPGEIFVELGQAIKRSSPFQTTLVVELTNDVPDYIPTRKAFAEGSYEVVNSRVQPGGGEKLVETAVQLLRELKR